MVKNSATYSSHAQGRVQGPQRMSLPPEFDGIDDSFAGEEVQLALMERRGSSKQKSPNRLVVSRS